MNLGIKEQRRFRDISWLMPAVDVCDVLDRLGVSHKGESNGEVMGFCPDHELFVGREPSHPKWSCNTETGETYCFTEPRGSNLFWVVYRLIGGSTDEVVHFMTGRDSVNIRASVIANMAKKLHQKEKRPKDVKKVRLDVVYKGLENRFISQSCYDFFMHPPNKKPTNIKPETVDRYQVFEMRFGYYSNRAIIPFFMHGELESFCAIDLLGKDKWLKEHPAMEEDDYSKVLYPLNSNTSGCLFGYDDCEVGCDTLIIVEGAREKMKLFQEGFPNSVACLSLDLSNDQYLLLTKLSPKEIVIMLDGDLAGYSGTDKMSKLVKKMDYPVRMCYLPPGKDPKNFNRDEFLAIIKRSRRS